MSHAGITVEAPASAWGDAAAWDREYEQLRAIPSSYRVTASHAFLRLQSAIGDVTGMRVLDLGAGTGRHSIHLAQRGAHVHAIDSSAVACAVHRERRLMSATDVLVENGTLDDSSLPDDTYDLIVDSYASCHILLTEQRRQFLDRLMSRLRPGGRIYTAAMGTSDSFYRRHSRCIEGQIVAVDPANSIAKLLQPDDIATIDHGELGNVLAHTTEHFADVVGQTKEHRVVHALVMTR